MKIFITGTAGFIGFHLAGRFLRDGHDVAGYDGFTSYYDVTLKRARHAALEATGRFRAYEAMLEDQTALDAAIEEFSPTIIVHLAAQAGVRYSLENPSSYISSNLVGTFNVLESARRALPAHLLIASTSSVYGGNDTIPFHETDRSDTPLSLYAATKRAAEAMSHSYAHLWQIPTTCFRFFTVYGPWGRPDMALFKFVDAMLRDEPIDLYGGGKMRRDFTYVDDLVEAIVRLGDAVPVVGKPVALPDGGLDSLSNCAPWRVVNIGGGRPEELLTFVEEIENAVGSKAKRRLLPMQKGDVVETFADPCLLRALTGYVPATSLKVGIGAFVAWYRSYYGTSS